MHIYIAPHRLISEVQNEFNSAFPFLKLEFLHPKDGSGTCYSVQQLIPRNRLSGGNQPAISDGYINIPGQMKVIDLENMLRDQFSLAAHVFRKSGNLWLETTMTDNWTLDQQNTHGREISTFKKEVREPGDVDLARDAEKYNQD